MSTTNSTASAQNRYRVTIAEQISYTIDVLAPDEEAAREIAFEASVKMDPESDGGDVEIETVDHDDPEFDPVNS